MKHNLIAAVVLVLASASVQANGIDNLITTSDSLKQTFALGIQTVGGQADYASLGGISPDMASEAHVSYQQAEDYNLALDKVAKANYNMTAQEYFDGQAAQAMNNLDEAVSAYVGASSDLIGAVVVNQMAADATTQEAAEQLQTYVTNNELAITTESVDTYNTALDMVETAAQSAAAFTAVANNETLVSSAQEQADALGESFSFAEAAFYDQGMATVTMLSGSVSLDVTAYYKTAEDILTAGADSEFYRTSPAGECFFNQESCYE